MSLALTAIKGAYFTSLALAIRQLISFLTIFYVAKILQPSDFGLVAMVMVVVGLAQVIGDVGFSTGLVRTQQNSLTALSTCFWVGISIGLVLTTAVVLLTPFAARFYNTDQVEPLLRFAALGLLINCCMPVPLAILQQRLAYKEIAVSQALGSLTGAIATCTLAEAGFGTWSLVIQPICGNLASVALMMIYAKWLPSFRFNYGSVREIMGDGVNMLGIGIAQYARGNFDSALIGSYLPSKDLGFYTMSRTILYAPTHLITSVVSRVIFPLLAKIQHDRQKVKETILTAITRTALLVFPLFLGLFAVIDDFVFLAFGAGWMSMVPMIKIMIVPAVIQSISYIMSPIFVALGKSKLSLKISIYGAIFYFLVLLYSVQHGLMAVAYAYSVTSSIIGIATIFFAIRMVNIPLNDLLVAIGRPLFYSFLMAGVVTIMRANFSGHVALRLSILVSMGVLVYVCIVLLFEKKAVHQLRSAMKN